MRGSGLIAILSAVVLTVVAGVQTVGATGAGGYVALGDSYSAGLGAGNDYSGGSCDRSPAAFPTLWGAAHPSVAQLTVACAGATSAGVIESQVGSMPRATTLVSITVGGNDVGFSTIMTACALHGTAACVDAVNSAEQVANGSLPARLDATYDAITAAAPNARVVVLGYPLFYQLHVWFCIGLSQTSRAKIDEGIGVVDEAIATAARRHGFIFADVRSAFAGHQLCSGSKWIHAADLAHLQESYHPTEAGQREGYLPAFSTAAG